MTASQFPLAAIITVDGLHVDESISSKHLSAPKTKWILKRGMYYM